MNRPITLQAASSADMPFLLSLRKLTMTEHLLRVGLPVDDDAHDQRIRLHFEDATIICEGSERIGLLKLSRAVDEWHLHQIQILPDHQGNGVGRLVLCTVLEEARLERVPVSLSVVHGNPARRLYEQLGFRPVAETSIDAKLIWRP
ncbi:GNAT family N-acetyltransferase [Burkholderia sp. Ac-20353]|uniref:GNAT family N-acetyltransferase n=1 Tax=Burkholderia sp. Ac-20353 TaxID=2703894 RepID=UPI00197BD09E|nr:GNAT family N-acetyltransferase [Burkholderia sp. Ac-20353]MBN3788286.1 GNAT family N-acetyltransferase [Burkholderia sp. Ac-20353]